MSKLLTVIGGTGAQGSGVVKYLLAKHNQEFRIRVPTRDPSGQSSKKFLETLGDKAGSVELVKADITSSVEELTEVFKGSYGAFLVTNFWSPEQMKTETATGKKLVQACKDAGVQHVVWSTLADCATISSGKYHVAHFTGKALVDETVASSGFTRYHFVRFPFYLQNLLTAMNPVQLPDGRKGWGLPIDPSSVCAHMGDVDECGEIVANVFASRPEDLPNGAVLDMCSGLYSFNQIAEAFSKASGEEIVATGPVPAAVYDSFFPGASEMRDMMQYWEEYTYFGPGWESRVEAANKLRQGRTGTPADAWLAANVKKTQ